ncbi:hypothetical protein BJ742DRAFT_820733 [Cladochytrium replicatum]|nr:hypothetical protein BJ742DRAFT_820733 [Cladochytrium replicatum]
MAVNSKPVTSMVSDASQKVGPALAAAKDYAVSTALSAHAFLGKYPPLKIFVYSVAATSAIPVATFVGFTSLTLGACMAVAGTGVALVQGGFLAFSGFVLFWFLAGAFILACIATFWLSAIYFAFQVGKRLENSL